MPWLPMPWPLPHGRLGGGVTLRWPGGPLARSGHGGRGFLALLVTGAGVGSGLTVGPTVGRGVGFAGTGVATGRASGGAVADPEAPVGAVGVGPTATIGSLGVGSSEGPGWSEPPGSPDGPGGDAVGSGDDPVVDEGLTEPLSSGGPAEALGVAGGTPLAMATSRSAGPGPMMPAVSATVARMRLTSPMATTKRAR